MNMLYIIIHKYNPPTHVFLLVPLPPPPPAPVTDSFSKVILVQKESKQPVGIIKLLFSHHNPVALSQRVKYTIFHEIKLIHCNNNMTTP